MNLKKYQPVFYTGIISLLVYLLHKLFFYFNQNNPKFQNFYFQIEIVYSFFLVCSFLIVFALIKVKEKNIDNVGFAFLWLTCIKIGFSFAFLSPILHSGNPNVRIEKLNFFIIFAIFLTIETVVTAKILNNKQ
jgi:hypothetical protein